MTTLIDCDKISFTAKLIAYFRSYSDIPFSKEIAEACGAQQEFERLVVKAELLEEEIPLLMNYMPRVEARYKSIDSLLIQSGCTNILELAAGLSPRGLNWSKDPDIVYVVSDLLDMMLEHIRLFDAYHSSARTTNLILKVVDARSKECMNVVNIILKSPVAIVCEGLLPYLSHHEKVKVAENIRTLLKSRGGVWITPDIVSLDQLRQASDSVIVKIRRLISDQSERDIEANSFETTEEGERFFEKLGFNVTRHMQGNLVHHPLSSVATSKVDPEKIQSALASTPIWSLRIK